jgi:hypothetical protein
MRAKNVNKLSVVSILFLTIACTTFPAWADVNITAAQVGEPNEVIISFDASSESNLVLELALDVRPENNANITEVTDTNECLKDSDPGYITWEACGKPDCWCYRHQCQGDADGFAEFGRHVGLNDLRILKAEFGRTITELQNMGSHACADFDHLTTFGRPVALPDLNGLFYNFGKPDLPNCPMTHLNYYIDP